MIEWKGVTSLPSVPKKRDVLSDRIPTEGEVVYLRYNDRILHGCINAEYGNWEEMYDPYFYWWDVDNQQDIEWIEDYDVMEWAVIPPHTNDLVSAISMLIEIKQAFRMDITTLSELFNCRVKVLFDILGGKEFPSDEIFNKASILLEVLDRFPIKIHLPLVRVYMYVPVSGQSFHSTLNAKYPLVADLSTALYDKLVDMHEKLLK